MALPRYHWGHSRPIDTLKNDAAVLTHFYRRFGDAIRAGNAESSLKLSHSTLHRLAGITQYGADPPF